MNRKEITNEPVVLTAEMFSLAVSSNGGYSRKQLALFGIPFPPIKGWKKQLLGTLASRKVVDEFIELKDKHLTKNRKNSKQQTLF